MHSSSKRYYVYMVTNPARKVLYTGVTNSLYQRITEHFLMRGNPKTFAGKYHCYLLIYFESFQYVRSAIFREKEIKGWRREKKVALIAESNPEWNPLNEELFGSDWPPKNMISRGNNKAI